MLVPIETTFMSPVEKKLFWAEPPHPRTRMICHLHIKSTCEHKGDEVPMEDASEANAGLCSEWGALVMLMSQVFPARGDLRNRELSQQRLTRPLREEEAPASPREAS